MLKVFSIYDSKIAAFTRPFYEQSKGSAIRSVGEALKDSNSLLSKHPGDFTLFELGFFDEATGLFDLYKTPESVGLLLEFVVTES